MYVCICARVRECELRAAVQAGARTEDAVGEACGAGTGCGSCLDRVQDVILETELAELSPQLATRPDTLAPAPSLIPAGR